jgi:hypothetical protein
LSVNKGCLRADLDRQLDDPLALHDVITAVIKQTPKYCQVHQKLQQICKVNRVQNTSTGKEMEFTGVEVEFKVQGYFVPP